MLYAKLFTSIYQGTLRGNSHGLLVFTNLLAHADPSGVVDIHPRAIAEEVGLTRDQVQVAIDELEAPDIESRSPEEGGRRIIRMDDHRAWGWQIVNYIKYRAIRNEDDRRDQNRIAQATWRAKQANKQSKPASAEVSPCQVQSAHTEGEGDTEENHSLLAQASALPVEERPAQDPTHSKPKGPPACPHLAVLALWAETLPAMPQHLPTQWRGTRSSHLRARWRETATEKGWTDEAQGLTYLRKLFSYVGQSQFLTGKAKPRGDGRPFVAELEWLVNPANWAKVHEGKYHGEAS